MHSLPENLEQAERLAKALYPDLHGQTPTIPKQGMQGLVLIFGDKVIKMPFADWGLAALENEAKTLKRLQECGIQSPIPQILDYDPEYHILVTSRVAGTPLTPEMFQNMSQESRIAIGTCIGNFLHEMHALEIPTKSEKDNSLADYYVHISSLCDDFAFCSKAGLQRGDVGAVKNYLTSQSDLNDHIVFVHTDVGYGNILYDPATGCVSFIDFASCRVGYRHIDFMKMANFPRDVQMSCLAAYNAQTDCPLDIDMIELARKAVNACRAAAGAPIIEVKTPQPD